MPDDQKRPPPPHGPGSRPLRQAPQATPDPNRAPTPSDPNRQPPADDGTPPGPGVLARSARRRAGPPTTIAQLFARELRDMQEKIARKGAP
jgi:hypothetical protein